MIDEGKPEFKTASTQSLGPFWRIKEATGVHQVKPERWIQLKLMADSSAGESVIPLDEAENVLLAGGDWIGYRYAVASGQEIFNVGQKMCAVVTKSGERPKTFSLQVFQVSRRSLSVIELVKSGHKVVFGQKGSNILDKATGLSAVIDQKNGSREFATLGSSGP